MDAADASDGFASFLHNPYAEKYLTLKQKAAVMVFKRKGRFVEGYCPKQELRQLIMKFFGDTKKLHQNGLIHHYHLLRDAIEKRHLIGLILYGADRSNLDETDQDVGTYTTLDMKQIKLTLNGICRYLLQDHFDEDDDRIDQMCEKTPGFKWYFDA